uniref:Coiled-coil domain-containing protein 192 n=1 Tax=Mus spicilegus TaxID=10103 RepID=A0A8C6H0D9_MUSSI
MQVDAWKLSVIYSVTKQNIGVDQKHLSSRSISKKTAHTQGDHNACSDWSLSVGNSPDSGQTVFSLEHLEICLKEAEEKARALLEQLTASEATKSQLLEKISMLEGRLEDVNQKNVGGELYENMVLEKDKCIEKLQAEVKASQEKLNTHKLKHKKAVKKLQTDLAIAKQEAAITVLELNEKIMTLCEGRPFPRATNSVEVLYGGLPPVEESDRKFSLIMELSTQLSLQTEKITQLEDILAEKEKKIEELEAECTSQVPQGSVSFLSRTSFLHLALIP